MMGSSSSQDADAAGFFALAAGTDFELDLGALDEEADGRGVDRRVVHEQVVTVTALDEAEAASGVEPLDRAARRVRSARRLTEP